MAHALPGQVEQGQDAGGVEPLREGEQHHHDDAAEGQRLDDEARQLAGEQALGAGLGVGAGRRLEPGREEVIAAGAIIVRTIMETLGMSSVLVSDLGLREGVLIDLARRMG